MLLRVDWKEALRKCGQLCLYLYLHLFSYLLFSVVVIHGDEEVSVETAAVTRV